MTNKTTDNCNEEQKIAELKTFNEKIQFLIKHKSNKIHNGEML